jgi:hypothetical protein
MVSLRMADTPLTSHSGGRFGPGECFTPVLAKHSKSFR